MSTAKKKTSRARFAPPFVQIAACVTQHAVIARDTICLFGLDKNGRVWRRTTDGWHMIPTDIDPRSFL